MAEFEVSWVGLSAFAGHMQAAPTVVREELGGAVKRLVDLGVQTARQHIHNRSGRLAGTLTHGVSVGGSSITGHWEATQPYARFVEEGRGPVVAHGRALRFEIGGDVLFRKSVGPAAPRPFLRPSIETVQAWMPGELSASMARIIARIGAS